MTRLLKNEAGYSLVEVMVSIMILAIAIIPMVSMFDMGLNAATRGSNYDKARAFANERLERAKTLPYPTVNGNGFPGGATLSGCGSGCRRYAVPSVPASAGLPDGATYTVAKQYVRLQPNSNPASLQNRGTDTKMIRVTVTANWGSNNSFTVSGVVAGGLV